MFFKVICLRNFVVQNSNRQIKRMSITSFLNSECFSALCVRSQNTYKVLFSDFPFAFFARLSVGYRRASHYIFIRLIFLFTIIVKNKEVWLARSNYTLERDWPKCFVWSVMLYGSETFTMRKSDRDWLEALQQWIIRRTEGLRWI